VNKAYLDANVVLDFLDGNRRYHNETVKVFDLLSSKGYELVISEDIHTTIYYVLKDKRIALDFLSMVVDEWQVVSFGLEVIRDGIHACQTDSSLDLEDVLQALAAKSSGCDLILTNDAGFYQCGLVTKHVIDFA
jgi:predicted nucleic acid-binding protein